MLTTVGELKLARQPLEKILKMFANRVWGKVSSFRAAIAPVLSNLTTSRDNIFSRINYSESLLKLTKLVSQTEADLLLAEAAKNLALSRQQAREIKAIAIASQVRTQQEQERSL